MKFLKVFLAVFILTISSAYLVKAGFREPTSDTDSVDAPVTSLAPGQIKIGSLNLSWLSVLGDLTTGYVGIGGDANNPNSIPQEKLDIQGSANIHNQIFLNTFTKPTDGQVLHFTYDDVTGLPKLRWGGNYAWVNFTSDVKNPGCNLNGICETGESCGNCPGDCAPPTNDVCDVSSEGVVVNICDYDMKCEAANGETRLNCRDCRGCENPGLGCNNNGICEDTLSTNANEGWDSCSNDCICGLKDYDIKQPSPFCGDGKIDIARGEECEPPTNGNNGQDLCYCDEYCHHVCKTPKKKPTDTPPPNLGGGGDTTPPGNGSGTCKNNSTTGAPQCGGSCPNPNETCQDNNGGSPGGLCQCLPPPPGCDWTATGGVCSSGTCPTPTDVCVQDYNYATCKCVAPDNIAPASVTTLSSSNVTSSSVTLNWFATGDDGMIGTATLYDIRYSTSLINSGNFNSKTQVSNPPTPLISGTAQSITVSGLLANTTYYFAMKVVDEASNASSISNVISVTTSSSGPDVTPPAAITSLQATNLGTTVNLTWIAPGDDGMSGTATSYDIRYNTIKITNANFNTSTQVSNPPVPAIAGIQQSKTIMNLTNGLIYYFAIKTKDEVPNTSLLSNVIGIEVGGNGGSFPAFNGSTYKNPFASLFNLFNFGSIEKAQAQSGGTCGDTWLPLGCYDPYSEYTLGCVNGSWIRTCFKEL